MCADAAAAEDNCGCWYCRSCHQGRAGSMHSQRQRRERAWIQQHGVHLRTCVCVGVCVFVRVRVCVHAGVWIIVMICCGHVSTARSAVTQKCTYAYGNARAHVSNRETVCICIIVQIYGLGLHSQNLYSCMHTCIHAYIHTYLRAYKHTCIHTYTYTYALSHCLSLPRTDIRTNMWHNNTNTLTHRHYMCVCVCVHLCVCT